MPESFIQFSPQGLVPFPYGDKYCYLNPGTFNWSINSANFPMAYETKCTRFRFLVRGKWNPRMEHTLTAFLLVNEEIVPGTEMHFENAGSIPVVTRHQTVYPNLKIYPTDTVGIYVKTHRRPTDVTSFYASAILNFDNI